jgi:hypothetical protein
MENLFRLVLARPAVGQDPARPNIVLAQDSDFQNAVRAAVETGTGRAGIEDASTAYAASPAFVADVDATPLGAQLDELADRLDALATTDPGPTWADLAEVVRSVFDRVPRAVVASDEYAETVRRLRDSLLAIKVLQELHTLPIGRLTRQLRTAQLIAEIAQALAANSGAETADLRTRRRRSVALPIDLGLTSTLSTRDAAAELARQRQELADARDRRIDDLLSQHRSLSGALDELATLEASQFRASDRAASEAVRPPVVTRLNTAAVSAATFTKSLREQVAGPTPVPDNPDVGDDGGGNARIAGLDGSFAALARTLVAAPQVTLPGRRGFSPPDLTAVGFILKPEVPATLSEPTQTVLARRGLEAATMPLDRITQRLEVDLASLVLDLESVAGHPERRTVVRIGDAMVTIVQPVTTGWGQLGTGGIPPFPHLPFPGSVPRTRGKVAPAGVADLLLVMQQLTGYEAADVAHIENVLRGERKVREHTRREETEITTLTERETTTSEEHELETTDRFEMTRETSQTIKEDVALKAGLTISGSYGPTVEFAASAEGSASRSKEEATKSAASYSQDVTERSSRKIAERVLERTTVRTLTETIETNTHELDNTVGPGHISGVYQWVNKVYEAQLFNYGLRAMFDFMVPEPGAFLVAALEKASVSLQTLTKPPDFDLLPSQITESNYSYWVRQCGATDVTPPPEIYRTKSAFFKGSGGESGTNYNHAEVIAIDDGYRAVYGTVGHVANVWEDDHSLDVVLGRRTQRLTAGEWLWTTTLDGERDSIPLALDSLQLSQVAVAVEVKTQRTDRALEKWKVETHAKLVTAHRAAVADYEEKLAGLKLQAGVAIRGRNPAANDQMIRRELRKDCISILTDQHFDLFDAIETAGSTGLPQINVSEAAAEGAYVRFFEQAFEWEHISWVTYPYFWGRKDQWEEKLGYDDPDPAFTDFVQAGFCRVSVPARPGFEGAIDHFLTFGRIWNGGPLPTISSDLYLPIADEIAEQLDRPGTEVPQGEPWTVRVPTNLVKLRADDQLPRWEKDANGEWVEAAD